MRGRSRASAARRVVLVEEGHIVWKAGHRLRM
jgi:hypothetical protein